MKGFLTLTLLLVGVVSYTSAQETVYVIQDNKKEKSKTSRKVEHMNVLKYDLLQTFTGEISFSYERVIGEKLSLELTLGPTIADLQAFRFTNAFIGGPYTREGRLGVATELGLRYYPLDNMSALNKLYISPVVGFKNYVTKLSPIAGTNPSLSAQKDVTNRLYYTFNVGFQQWLSKDFSFDYYFGLGIANVNTNSYYINENYDPNTNTISPNWVKTSRGANVIQVSMGIKLGIGWTGGYKR